MLQQLKIRTTAGRGRLFDSILDTVGDTPVIRINNLGPGHATIYAKAEFFNPAASVKDRLALNIIEEGERSGALKPARPWSRRPAATPASGSPWSARKRATRWW